MRIEIELDYEPEHQGKEVGLILMQVMAKILELEDYGYIRDPENEDNYVGHFRVLARGEIEL